ncbi:hypothetical protein [Thermus tengchongensis]|uniref:hypothetical protein n=1 Tax=Thermus tengchongensis TaxID=1214928 RepID=UPI001F0EF18D|nr:hypothetical protein [Thermus tengchongensis]
MRLKRFSGRVRRVVRKEASRGDLLAQAEALKGEGGRAIGFPRRLLGLLREAQRRWGSFSPEERQRFLALLTGLLALLPLGRLGRVGWLLKRAAGPEGQALLGLLLRLLKR